MLPQRLKPCNGVGWQTCARTDPLCQSAKEPRGGRGSEQLCVLNPGVQAQKIYLGLLLRRQRPFWGAGTLPGNDAKELGTFLRQSEGWDLDKHLLFPLKTKFPLLPSTQVEQPGRREAAARQRRKVGAWCLPCPSQPPLPQFPLPANELNNVATSEGPWGWQGHEPGEEKALSGVWSHSPHRAGAPLGFTCPSLPASASLPNSMFKYFIISGI